MRYLLTAVLHSSIAAAQIARPHTASIQGTIFDSIAMRPLGAAAVQLASADSTARPRARTTLSDTLGHFQFEGVPAGRYAVGFQHPALFALGLDAPIRAIQIGEDAHATLDLAIPPGQQVSEIVCGKSTAVAAEGLLSGYVINAASGGPIAGAPLKVHWMELGVIDKRLRPIPRALDVFTNEGGAFHLCGVPTGTAIEFEVAHPEYRPLSVEVTIPETGVLRFDPRLASSSRARGSATITGKIVHSDGSLVTTGAVHVANLELSAPVTDGTFALTGLPAGTWPLETRIIGYEPQVMLVDAMESASVAVTITVGTKIQVLDAMNVVGLPNRDQRILNEVIERRRVAFGTTFLPDNNWLKSSLVLSDAIAAARGFRLADGDSIVARGCNMPMSILGIQQHIVFRIDGVPYNGSLAEIQNLVRPSDVLAMELYPDQTSIPSLWRSSDACALIAIWTKK